MRYSRPIIGITVAAALGAFALPSQAAKSATLYFDNKGAYPTGTCNPKYVLTSQPPTGSPCEGITVAAFGTGFVSEDNYKSDSSSVGWTLDAKRPLTGTIYVGSYPIISVNDDPNATSGGLSGAEVTIKVNGVTVGTVSGDDVAGPGDTVAIPVKLRLPKRLDQKRVRTVTADVTTTSGTGLTGVSYGDRSKLVFPTS